MPVGGMPTSKNYTFSNNRMGDIGRENQALLQRLQRTTMDGSKPCALRNLCSNLSYLL